MQYQNGDGVGQNEVLAAAWFRRAAEQGHAEAQYSLGVMYNDGTGVVQDKEQAAEWFRKASAQGHVLARWMYNFGTGVHQDANSTNNN